MAIHICPALPHGATKFYMRSMELGAAAMAHVAVAEATSEKGGRLYADTAGAFTAATGCTRQGLPDTARHVM